MPAAVCRCGPVQAPCRAMRRALPTRQSPPPSCVRGGWHSSQDGSTAVSRTDMRAAGATAVGAMPCVKARLRKWPARGPTACFFQSSMTRKILLKVMPACVCVPVYSILRLPVPLPVLIHIPFPDGLPLDWAMSPNLIFPVPLPTEMYLSAACFFLCSEMLANALPVQLSASLETTLLEVPLPPTRTYLSPIELPDNKNEFLANKTCWWRLCQVNGIVSRVNSQELPAVSRQGPDPVGSARPSEPGSVSR